MGSQSSASTWLAWDPELFVVMKQTQAALSTGKILLDSPLPAHLICMGNGTSFFSFRNVLPLSFLYVLGSESLLYLPQSQHGDFFCP